MAKIRLFKSWGYVWLKDTTPPSILYVTSEAATNMVSLEHILSAQRLWSPHSKEMNMMNIRTKSESPCDLVDFFQSGAQEKTKDWRHQLWHQLTAAMSPGHHRQQTANHLAAGRAAWRNELFSVSYRLLACSYLSALSKPKFWGWVLGSGFVSSWCVAWAISQSLNCLRIFVQGWLGHLEWCFRIGNWWPEITISWWTWHIRVSLVWRLDWYWYPWGFLYPNMNMSRMVPLHRASVPFDGMFCQKGSKSQDIFVSNRRRTRQN